MGGTEYEPEKPVHSITLTEGFFLGVYPVTQAQWNAVMGTEPSLSRGPNKPVETVSWDDCQEFCTTLTALLGGQAAVRLPTETEWEFACRAGTTTHFHFGDAVNTDLANYNGMYSWNGSPRGKNRKSTTDVGTFAPNPWGLFDLHGNVWEWCADVYRPYSVTGTEVSSENQFRVIRGGSWVNYPWNCRSASRERYASASRYCNVGFRVCFRLEG
jgi:formylglycine-generating enzyme required for sulfatase activity